MKLEYKNKISCYQGQILATLEEQVRNNTLKKLLIDMRDNKFETSASYEPLKSFIPGLKENFLNNGFIKKDGTLTSKGEDVIDTGITFNTLNGSFNISFVENNKYLYITDCELTQNDDNKDGVSSSFIIPWDFGDNEYITINNKVIRNVIPMSEQFLLTNIQQSDAVTTYDFESKKSNSEIKIEKGSKSLNIETDNTSKFSLLDTATAIAKIRRLGLPFYFDNNNKFWIKDSLNKILEQEYAESILNNIYKKGTFNFSSKSGNITITECQLNIESNRVLEVLNHYLLKNIENKYLGYNEIGRLIIDFPHYFENKDNIKAQITDSTENIYNELKNTASEKNQKAFRRLQAYQDLCPDILLKDSVVKGKAPIDYSGTKKSWSEIINEIFDNSSRNIKSVTTLSKYVYSNKWIAYNMELISECLATSGAKLNVIYSKDNSYVNKNWNKNSSKFNTIEKKWDEIKTVHDRYWKITRQDSSVDWFKISGEVDALRYNQDNLKNINKDTKGNIKEMTVTFIKESGVPDNVKQIFR